MATPKPAGALVRCLSSHETKHGPCREGDLLRQDDPRVAVVPRYWIAGDATTEETQAARMALLLAARG